MTIRFGGSTTTVNCSTIEVWWQTTRHLPGDEPPAGAPARPEPHPWVPPGAGSVSVDPDAMPAAVA
jgi:hypothetical protein